MTLQLEQPALTVTPTLRPERFITLRRQLMLRGFKWDPQVGDENVVAPFALVITEETWGHLATLTRALAAETLAAENELLTRSDLWRPLALPRPLQKILGHAKTLTPTAGRIMRFDFHLTASGWQIAEVNSDVPGGYTEAATLPALFAAEFPHLRPAPDPAAGWIRAIAAAAAGKPIALLAATGYMEDRQILAYLQHRLEMLDLEAHVADLRNLAWCNGRAHLNTAGAAPIELGAILRFYQSEWLAGLPRRAGWQNLFVDARTPVTNPPAAALCESKGFPLTWNHLRTELPTWRQLLPETCSLYAAPWKCDGRWLLKEKFSNNGDSVIIPSQASPSTWRRVRRELWLHPNHWIAQRRFQTLPLGTPLGDCFPCIGVYAVDGEPAGIYARLSRGPVTDFRAIDVACLIGEHDDS